MDVDPDLSARFQPDLLRGERILWTGRPDPSRLLTKADVFLIPFGLVWTGGVASLFVAGFGDPGPPGPVFLVMPLMFLAVGFYFVIGRFMVLRFRKRRTAYAVTDRRVLVRTEIVRRSLQAASFATLPAIQKSVRRDGSGSIRFGTNHPFASMYKNTGLDFFGFAYGPSAPSFVDIPDVERVYRLVNDFADRSNG